MGTHQMRDVFQWKVTCIWSECPRSNAHSFHTRSQGQHEPIQGVLCPLFCSWTLQKHHPCFLCCWRHASVVIKALDKPRAQTDAHTIKPGIWILLQPTLTGCDNWWCMDTNYMNSSQTCCKHGSPANCRASAVLQLVPINAYVTWWPRSVDWVGNGSQREDKKLLQHSQLYQHSEFQRVSVSQRQRSRLCGKNLCGNESRRERSGNGSQQYDKSVCISTTKASFSTKIVRLGHCMIAITTV